MRTPPGFRSRRLALSAAGFIATSTSGASPGVKMSSSAKCTWKPETPARVPAGARISAGKSGNVARSLPTSADVLGELRAGQLHAVAGVAGEADDDFVQRLLGRMMRCVLALGVGDHGQGHQGSFSSRAVGGRSIVGHCAGRSEPAASSRLRSRDGARPQRRVSAIMVGLRFASPDRRSACGRSPSSLSPSPCSR